MAKPNDIRRLGTLVVLGAIAGVGIRYYVENRARAYRDTPRLIDWEQARTVALRFAGSEEAPVLDRERRQAQYMALVKRSEPLIADYMGVRLPEPISRVYVFDRSEWLKANFDSFENLFRPIEEMYDQQNRATNTFAFFLRDTNSRLMGAQIGFLLGFLARRVLGQYDLSLLSPDPAVRGALYYVEPNIAQVQRGLGLSDEDFRLWIALHETTHVFEFEAYPWVREHFNGLVRQYFDQINDQLNLMGGGLNQLLERLINGIGSGQHWIELVLTPEQRKLFDELQALMSLVEGYSNHIMNAIGKKLLPSFEMIEQRMQQRQQNRPLIDQLVFRITGMNLKLVQYQQGEKFVNHVVEARGIQFANRVWERAEHLPTLEEIRNPQRWIARMGG
ncbi:MAG: zinc-dependent metalloprotease [Chloroflexaceae bacterium]|nr:zinc-dependent metalloprotease [Chloroflexaceae bacterium]